LPSDPVQDAINTTPSSQRTDVVWHHRRENPPPGLIWVTDGELVWLAWTEGMIPPDAYLIRAWTDKCVPKVPDRLPE
jgi:hypothetical protein